MVKQKQPTRLSSLAGQASEERSSLPPRSPRRAFAPRGRFADLSAEAQETILAMALQTKERMDEASSPLVQDAIRGWARGTLPYMANSIIQVERIAREEPVVAAQPPKVNRWQRVRGHFGRKPADTAAEKQ